MKPRNFRERFIRGLTFPEPSWQGRLLAFAFSSLFLGAGLLVASKWVFAFGDLFRMQRWEETDALVTSSKLAQSTNSEGSNLTKVLIHYDYTFRNQHNTGNRYDIGSTNTNIGVARMKEIVHHLQAGTPITVWVNPHRPQESIITRKLSPQVWIMIPFSAPFLLVGILGTGYGLFAGWFYRRSQQLKIALAPAAPPTISKVLKADDLNPNQKLIFPAMQSSYEGLAYLSISIFWNGIVAVFLVSMSQMLLAGDTKGLYLALFLIPFVIIGGIMAFMTFKTLTGPESPSWLILADGVLPDSESTLNLAWMPLNESSQNFRSCALNLVRWKSKSSFRKWQKINPTWKNDLIKMTKNTADETEISCPSPPQGNSFIPLPDDLHLIMAWTGHDGREHSNSWQLSPSRDND